jgi:hypothetical protein
LTVYEAQKCQAIINGYLDGILGYEEGVRRVAALPRPPPPGLRPE